MSVVILKFFNSDPKRSFLFSFYHRYSLFLSCNVPVRFMLYQHCPMLYPCFIRFATQRNQLYHKKTIIPLQYHFHSSIPNPCDIVSERAITQIVSKVLVLSCYSDSLTLAQVARPMRDTTAWVILDLTIFSGADSQFLLFTKRTHTIFIFYRSNSFAKSCTSINCIFFNTSLINV